MSKYHYLFGTQYSSWQELEGAIYALPTAQEKGEVFEQFVYLFLHLNRDYYQIKHLYRGKDVPLELRKRLALENTDYGVDGVFILSDDSVAAYQAKFRDSRGSATIRELATFWAESTNADYKYVIANSTALPPQAHKHGNSILAEKFDSLDIDFFENLFLLCSGERERQAKKATPHPFQERLIGNTISGFEGADRGKLIAACGAGKTLVSLWIVERMGVKTVLFLAPSLALIKQTLEAWQKHKTHKFEYMCVCSDSTVVSLDEDYGDYDVSEVDFPVTTDPEKIMNFLKRPTEYKYIFSTYASAHAVSEAIASLKEDATLDLTIFDEAHRTAGQKDSELYSISLDDKRLPSSKKLFMTATERLIRPWVVERAAVEDRVVFSMDNEDIYGKTFDRYSFGEAIREKVITDYKIVLTAVSTQEIASLINANQLLTSSDGTVSITGSADNIFKQIVLSKAMNQFGLKKAITFHSSVKRAKDFVNGTDNETVNLSDLFSMIWPESTESRKYFDWVDGQMPSGLRKSKLKEFEGSELGVISNAKCLTEGVDVPLIDTVYFVDPKTSLIDIVQACGRALRKSKDPKNPKEFAYFVVPVIVSSEDQVLGADDGKYETLLNLIQALRDQDERMADWVNKLNLSHAKGDTGSFTEDDPIIMDLPFEFDVENFTEQVRLKVIEGNSEPSIRLVNPEVSVRRSDFPKRFIPIGDTSFEAFTNNLVNPTIQLFPSPESEVGASKLKLTHNNLSHTQRLGLIEKADKSFRLTDLGKDYHQNSVDSKDVFKQAILEYDSGKDGVSLYPYLAVLDVLLAVRSINFIEFLYGLYTLQDTSPESIELAKKVISEIKNDYPNILRLNSANKNKVAEELNSKYGYNFRPNELWGSTTAKNKFLYFRNHLSLFDGVNTSSNEILLVPEYESELQSILEVAGSGLLGVLK